MRKARVLRLPPGSVQLAVQSRRRFARCHLLEGCVSRMSTGGQEHGSHHLFRGIEQDFESLARLIERAIELITVDGAANADIERLICAKAFAEIAASLAKKVSPGR